MTCKRITGWKKASKKQNFHDNQRKLNLLQNRTESYCHQRIAYDNIINIIVVICGATSDNNKIAHLLNGIIQQKNKKQYLGSVKV